MRTDTELIRAYAETQDETAFVELMSRHQGLVYGCCVRMLGNAQDAHDAVQSTFIVLAQKAGSLRKEGALNGWLYDVAHKVCLKALRFRERRVRREDAFASALETEADDGASKAQIEAALSCVDRELAGLSSVLREAVVMRYLQGHSEKDAAALAACPLGTMKRRASEGLSKLRQRLAKCGIALGLPVLTAALESQAQAALPEALLSSTMTAVKAYAAGGAATAAVSANVASLTKGVLNMMFWNSVKTAVVAVTAAVVVTGGGAIVAQEMAGQKRAVQPDLAGAQEVRNGKAVYSTESGAKSDNNQGGLHGRTAVTWQHVTKPLLPSDAVRFIKAGTKGEVWIGKSKGLVKVEEGMLRMVKETMDLDVWDVTARPDGGLWVGHSRGALLLNGEQTAKALGGFSVGKFQVVGNKLWAIAKDSKDSGKLMEARGDEWQPIELGKKGSVLDVVRDSRGTFWVVLDGDGVMEIDPGKEGKDAKHHLARLCITSILTDSQGRTWFGLMNDGVMMRQGPGGEWKRFLDKENTPVMSLVEDKDGKILAATVGNGIWTYDGRTWTASQEKEGVYLMKFTSDKRIWTSTGKGGLRYWTGTEWKTSLDSEDRKRSPVSVDCLVELPEGVLFAGTRENGLYVLADYNLAVSDAEFLWRGLAHWKGEDWQRCATTLEPFLGMRTSPLRAEALLMLARSYSRQNLFPKAMHVLQTIMKEHEECRAIEEVYTEHARLAIEVSEWEAAAETCKRFAAKFPNSARKPYFDLYGAAAQIDSGNVEAGAAALRRLTQADTFADVKADAYYRLAMLSLSQPQPDKAAASDLLRKSVACNSDAKSLLRAATCACDMSDWQAAREYVERFRREFPKADRVQLDAAEQLRQKIAQESGKKATGGGAAN